MRFSEWLDKMNKQQERLNDLALSEVSETISFPGPNGRGKVVTVTLGKNKYYTELDGGEVGARFLRQLYTNAKEEFDALLESLTQQTDQVCQATAVILESISNEALPQAVIDRMKGEKVSGDPADLVEAMTERKMGELGGLIANKLVDSIFDSLELDTLPSVADKNPLLRFDRGKLVIQWGSVQLRHGAITIRDTEEAMYFLANFELIKERLMAIVEQIVAIH